ncbi:MAG: TolC family protein [Vulcanimicrobiota bacterium]
MSHLSNFAATTMVSQSSQGQLVKFFFKKLCSRALPVFPLVRYPDSAAIWKKLLLRTWKQVSLLFDVIHFRQVECCTESAGLKPADKNCGMSLMKKSAGRGDSVAGHRRSVFTMMLLMMLLVFSMQGRAAADESSPGTPVPSPSPSLKAAEGPLLTIGEALTIALKGNREIQTAALSVGRGHDAVKAAQSAKYPIVSVVARNINYGTPENFYIQPGVLGTFPVLGPLPSTRQAISSVSGTNNFYSLDILQPVTGLYKVNNMVGVQKMNLDIEKEKERGQRQSVISNVKTEYFSMLDTMNARIATADNTAFLTDFLRVVKDRFTQGKVLRTEVLQVESQLESSRYQETSLHDQLLSQKEKFNILLGRPIDTPFSVMLPDDFQKECEGSEDLADLRRTADTQRPELLQRHYRVRQAEYQREVERYEWYPEVGLFATYTRQSNSGLLPADIGIFGIQARWTALDWGRRSALVSSDTKAIEQARKQVEQTRDQVQAEVNAAYRRLVALKSLREARKTAFDASEENLRVTVNRHKSQLALTRDVLQAQAQAAEARRQYEKSKLDYASTKAELDRIVGRDR